MKNILLLISFLVCTAQANAQGSIIFEHEVQGRHGIYIGSKDLKPQFLTKGDLPSPSPDGRSFAYVFPDSRSETTRSIRIMDIATGSSRELVGLNSCFPHWSPKGDNILFECFGSSVQIWIADTTGKNVKMLLDDAKNPAWSPDGKYFAFIRDFDLFTYELATGKEQRLYKTEEREKFPAWSPDGKRIAVRKSLDQNVIEIIELATGKKDTMATGISDHLAWTPRGQIIYDVRNNEGTSILMLLDPITKETTLFNKALTNGYWAEWINR